MNSSDKLIENEKPFPSSLRKAINFIWRIVRPLQEIKGLDDGVVEVLRAQTGTTTTLKLRDDVETLLSDIAVETPVDIDSGPGEGRPYWINAIITVNGVPYTRQIIVR